MKLRMTQSILDIINTSMQPYEEMISGKKKKSCANTLAHLNDHINWDLVGQIWGFLMADKGWFEKGIETVLYCLMFFIKTIKLS